VIERATAKRWITAGAVGVIACGVLAGAAAASPSVWTVTSAEQRQRDQARQRILEDELRAEERARAEALGRAAERERAGDARGVAEARAALARHEANLAALRQELARPTTGGATAASEASRKVAVSNAATARTVIPPSPWDVYARASTPAPSPPTGDAADWDLYARPRPALRDPPAAGPARPLSVTRALAGHDAFRPVIPREELRR
jgi:hypothetical protein